MNSRLLGYSITRAPGRPRWWVRARRIFFRVWFLSLIAGTLYIIGAAVWMHGRMTGYSEGVRDGKTSWAVGYNEGLSDRRLKRR